MPGKSEVPIYLKFFGEADQSIDKAVSDTRDKLKSVGSSVTQQTAFAASQTLEKAADAIRGLSPERAKLISDRAIADAKVKIRDVTRETETLDSSFKRIGISFENAFKSGGTTGSQEALKLARKANELEVAQKKVADAAKLQAESANKLKNSDGDSSALLKLKQELNANKEATLQAKLAADSIRRDYAAAYRDVAREISKAVTEQKRFVAEQERANAEQAKQKALLASKSSSDQAAKDIALRGLEIDLLKRKHALQQQENQFLDESFKKHSQQLLLEKAIANVKNPTARTNLGASFANLEFSENQAQEARKRSLEAIRNLELSTQAQINLIHAGGNAAQIADGKRIIESQKLISASAAAEARKFEAEYTRATKKIAADINKALKDPGQRNPGGGGGGGGIGFLSPILNQASSGVDAFIGSLGSRLGFLKTQVGLQIGLGLSNAVKSAFDSVSASAQAQSSIIKKFAELNDEAKVLIQNVGTGVIVAAAAGAAAIGGLVGVLVSSSAKFEVLEAKLVTLFKSPAIAAEKFKEAVKLAASTPFDVSQVVQAQVQLAALGQTRSADLKLTADLAAGLNRDLNETATVVGKALAGSLEGYEALRNSFGITTLRIKEFGGAVDSQNRILVTNEYQLNKNRDALRKIISLDFGGGTDRISRTLTGALSNLSDEAIKLSAGFGQSLLPSAKSLVFGLTGVLNILNQIDPVTKSLISFGLIGAGSMAALTAGVGSATIALGIFSKALAAASASKAIVEIQGMSRALGFLTAANDKAIASLGNVTAYAPYFLILAGAVAIANAGIEAWDQSLKKIDAETARYTQNLALARRATNDFNSEIQKLGLNNADLIANPAIRNSIAISLFNKAVKEKGALEFSRDLASAGVSQEELRKRTERQNEALKQTNEDLAITKALLQSLKKEGENSFGFLRQGQKNVRATTLQDLIPPDLLKSPEVVDRLASRFPALSGAITSSKAKENIGAIAASISLLEAAAGKLAKVLLFGKESQDNIAKVATALDSVQKDILKFSSLAAFAKKAGDTDLLNESLQQQIGLLDKLKVAIRPLVGEGQELTSKRLSEVLGGADEQSKALINAYFATKDTIFDLQNQIAGNEAKTSKTRIEAIKFVGEVQIAQLKKSESETKLSVVKQQLEAVKGKAQEYIGLLVQFQNFESQLKKAKKESDRDRLRDILKQVQAELNAKKEGADAELGLLRERTSIEAEIRNQAIEKIKNQVSKTVADAKAEVSGGKFLDGQAGVALEAADKVKIYTRALQELNDLQNLPATKLRLTESESLRKSFQDQQRALNGLISTAKLSIPVENFKKLNLAIKENITGAEDLRDKLKELRLANLELENAYARGAITQRQLREGQLDLRRQQIATAKQVLSAELSQYKTLEAGRKQQIDDEIQILELKKKNATTLGAQDAIEKQIANRRKQSVQADLLILQQEKNAQLAKPEGRSKELIEQEFRQKESSLLKKAYIEFVQNEEAKRKVQEETVNKALEQLGRLKENRLGGSNSPIISVEELGKQSELGPGFGSDLTPGNQIGFREQSFRNRSAFQPSVPTLEQFSSRFNSINGTNASSEKPVGEFDKLKQLAPTTNNINVYINGDSVPDIEAKRKAREFVNSVLDSNSSRRNLLQGSESGGIGSGKDQY